MTGHDRQSLGDRIRSEASVASRSGQHDRLLQIADEVDAALMAAVRAHERQIIDLRARVAVLPTVVIEPMARLYVSRAHVLALFDGPRDLEEDAGGPVSLDV